MKAREPGLQFYVDKLGRNEQFSFIRYGDGEWSCILQRLTRTGSGSQKFSPGLRKALEDSISVKRSGAYYRAMNPGRIERCRFLPQVEAWLASNAPGLDWHQCTIFYKASFRGQLFPIVKELKRHRVVVVGPKWLEALPFASEFVQVRSHNCWQDADAIFAQLRDLKDVVIAFSAGPATKVLIHRLQPILGEHSWLIDFGSVWDPYCGIKSRKYHKGLTPEILRRNMTGK